ncbi:hypothetical protein [Rhizobium lentis]|uniref:Uncharacterized protein n=1 Tax=Rhizobium lentis TaxID=1138194 RepID=A0A7W8XJ42_9HYPH|nr:hypothetical protein [Rhizobium lentis]MBB5553661.1 hypothetical protein [Rhizobium lentis]MBB5563780.1 hypothetical protein [Rhizobium lentis]MBB5570705.1 hypothetical protein [Rhizobium lentis]
MNDGTTITEARKKELGELAQRNIEGMAFPASDWEADTLAEVLALPRVVVTRPPVDALLAADMAPYHCHANCANQEANDPDGTSRHVTGWLVYGSDLILHSVVQIDGEWLCMTPQLVPVAKQFQFIPDPLIEWRVSRDGSGNEAFRGGIVLPEALRRHPQDHIRVRDRFRELMASGLSAFDARKVVEETLGDELKRSGMI